MISKKRMKNLFAFIIINILIFQSFIQEKIVLFKYFDEIVACFSLLYFVFTLKNLKIKKIELSIILGIVILISIGIIGTIKYQYQLQFQAIFTDIFNIVKFFVTLLGLNQYFKNNNIEILKSEINFQKPIIIITFMFMILNTLIGINGMTYEVRYGIRAFQFIYGHAGTLNVITIFQICFILFDLIRNKNNKNLLYFILCELILISTLRSRAFVFVALSLIIYYSFIRSKKNIKIYFILGIIIAILISKTQIETYFNNDNRTPRSDLLNGSIQLMKECFPIGTGFATYGSYAASKYYSVLYYRFGFNNYFGMSDLDSQFLTDNFWPIIIGEFGFLGFIVYLIILYNIFKYLWYECNSDEKKAIFLSIFAIMCFNSTGSSSFVHYTAITYAMILTYLINYKKKEVYDG